MTLLKNIILLTITLIFSDFCFGKNSDKMDVCFSTPDMDSVKYSKQIKTSLVLLKLIAANQKDSIIDFYINECWAKRYRDDIKLYNSTLDDATSLIKEFGLPTQQNMTIIKGNSREKCEPGFADKYGVAIRYTVSQKTFKTKFGLIEFYFTEDEYDKVSIIFSSNPKQGRKQ